MQQVGLVGLSLYIKQKPDQYAPESFIEPLATIFYFYFLARTFTTILVSAEMNKSQNWQPAIIEKSQVRLFVSYTILLYIYIYIEKSKSSM